LKTGRKRLQITRNLDWDDIKKQKEVRVAKKKSKQIGIVLLIIGVGLLIWGFNLYGAFGSKLARTIGGSPSTETMLILIGGAVCAGLGAYNLFRK